MIQVLLVANASTEGPKRTFSRDLDEWTRLWGYCREVSEVARAWNQRQLTAGDALTLAAQLQAEYDSGRCERCATDRALAMNREDLPEGETCLDCCSYCEDTEEVQYCRKCNGTGLWGPVNEWVSRALADVFEFRVFLELSGGF